MGSDFRQSQNRDKLWAIVLHGQNVMNSPHDLNGVLDSRPTHSPIKISRRTARNAIDVRTRLVP
jgi:hypothetical protein